MEFTPKTNNQDTDTWSPIPEPDRGATALTIWNPDGTPNTQPYGVERVLVPAPDGYGMIDKNYQPPAYAETYEDTSDTFTQKVDNFRNAAMAIIITGSAAWAGAEAAKPGITQDVYNATEKVFEHTPGGPVTIAIGSAALLGASLWSKFRQNKESTNSPEQ